MELGLGLLGLFLGLVVIVGAFAGLAAWSKTSRLNLRIEKLEKNLQLLNQRLAPEAQPPAAAPPEPRPVAPPEIKPATAPPIVAVAVPPAIPVAPAAGPPPPPPPAPEKPASEKPAAKEPWTDLEGMIGKRWMTYVGAVVLFLAAGFFIKYAFDSGWLGPTARVGLGLVAGIVLLVVGDQRLRREMVALGQGLLGLGLAILFLSAFAAHGFYQLIPQSLAFVALVLIAALGMTLAVLRNAQPIAVLAILGAFLAPVLVSTGVDARDALFGYLALLDLAVLGVAFFRRWRVLDILSFVGTMALFGGWYAKFFDYPAWLPATAWLGAFYLIFLPLPFVYHLRQGTPVVMERFLMALANALAVFGFAYAILNYEHGYVLGFVALFMAACYLALGILVRRRVATDAKALFGFVSLAVAFLTLAVPLHLRVHGITLAWAIEGPVLLYLGYRYRYLPVRVGGAVIVAIAALRLLFEYLPLHARFFTLFFNRPFAGAVSVPLAAFALVFIHQRFRDAGTKTDRGFRLAAALAGGLLLLGLLHEEIGSWIIYLRQAQNVSWRPYVWPVAAAIWAIGSAVYTWWGWRSRAAALRGGALFFLLIAWILAVRQYDVNGPEGYLIFLNGRFASNLAVLAALTWALVAGRRQREILSQAEGTLRQWLFIVGLFMLLLAVSLEVYSYPVETYADRQAGGWLGQVYLSIAWGLYAIALLIGGFQYKWRGLRLAALALIGVTLLKLILLDMADLAPLYRIFAFLAVGLLMIGASYLYHRVEKRRQAADQGGAR